jgi:16S rRNA (uracil1498-N3)-methyltransferase
VITQLVPPAAFDLDEFWLEGAAYRHLFRARRVEVGQEVRVVDGRGRARWAHVEKVERHRAKLALGAVAPSNEPELYLELLVATLRPQRASWLVEKAAEVGVGAIRFLSTTRAPRSFGPRTMERFRRVAAAAVEQSHRARLPETTGVHSWGELQGLLSSTKTIRLLDPQAAAVEAAGMDGPAALLVGPEGGWTPGEHREILASGGQAVGLGSRILRTETAAVVGAALFLMR